MKTVAKPQEGEYAPYAIAYISLLPDDGLLIEHLKKHVEITRELALSQSEEQLITPCASGEWTIKEILVHIIDTERIYAYRALRFARNDQTELPPYEQDAYAANSGANERSIEDILEELTAVRAATITLLKSFKEEAFTRSGIANNHTMSVRAAAYIIAGHELYHLQSIKENYIGTQ